MKFAQNGSRRSPKTVRIAEIDPGGGLGASGEGETAGPSAQTGELPCTADAQGGGVANSGLGEIRC
jgi:hypothetical protein